MPEPKRQRVRKNQGSAATSEGSSEAGDSWKQRITQLKSKEDPAPVIEAYESLVKEFPLSGWAWCEYANYLIAKSLFDQVDKVFSRCLHTVADVRVFESYLSYILRINPLTDAKGLQVVQQAYEFALQKCANDKQVGPLYQQFIQFLEKRPANTTWEQQHKMDEVRKAYRKAVSLPIVNIEPLWRGYNAFENGISRATARKFIDERSGAYMQARSCFRELETVSKQTSQPDLPPERTYDARDADQLAAWRRLVGFELGNPLGLEPDAHKDRMLYIYRHALQYCCFYPELWYDAIQWCVSQMPAQQTESLAKQGLAINKLSFALCMSLVTFYEESGRNDEAIETFRSSIELLKQYSQDPAINERLTLLYVELMQSTKRMHGVKEARKISAECRSLPNCTYQIYTASAAIEYQNNDSDIAAKIYEVAYRRFRNEKRFIQCYLQFLYARKDMTNARVVFEKALNDIGPHNAREIYDQYLGYEATFADLTALRQLEERYRQFYAVDLIELATRRYQQSFSDPIGKELHIKPKETKKPNLPLSIEKMVKKLPKSRYDGPDIDISQLISLVQQVC